MIKVPEKGWRTRAIFELWWAEHAVEFNRLAVNDPVLWEKIAARVEAFQRANRGTEGDAVARLTYTRVREDPQRPPD